MGHKIKINNSHIQISKMKKLNGEKNWNMNTFNKDQKLKKWKTKTKVSKHRQMN
jgi:hypothetical protein